MKDRKRPARYFGKAGWTTIKHDPLDDDEDWDVGMACRGWVEFCRTGPASTRADGGDPPLQLMVFHRPDADDGTPRFLVEVTGNLAESYEHVFVQGLEQLMALLASWAPAMRATALAHLTAAAAE